MKFVTEYGWMMLSILLPAILVIDLVNKILASKFYTKVVVKRSFTMFELRFPSSPNRLRNIIMGIYSLPVTPSLLTLKAVKMHLYLRFVYLTVLSAAIYILCMKAAGKMENKMRTLFIVISWLQIVAILLDLKGNLLLLKSIEKPHPPMSQVVYQRYLQSEFFRYSITMLGLIWGLFSFAYFMLLSQYSSKSLHYLLYMLSELVVYFILRTGVKRKKTPEDKNKSYNSLYNSLFGQENAI